MIILFILILRKHHYIYLFEKCLKRLNCTKNRTTYKIFVSRTTAKMSLCQCRTTKEPSASKEAQCLPCTEGREEEEKKEGGMREGNIKDPKNDAEINSATCREQK